MTAERTRIDIAALGQPAATPTRTPQLRSRRATLGHHPHQLAELAWFQPGEWAIRSDLDAVITCTTTT